MDCWSIKNMLRKFSLWDIYGYVMYVYLLIAAIPMTAFYYMAFAGLISLTVYLLIYEWFSLFSESIVHIVFSIFANFTEFGLFYVLFLNCYTDADYYITIMKVIIEAFSSISKELIQSYFEAVFEIMEACGFILSDRYKKGMIIISIIFTIFGGIGAIYLLFWIVLKKEKAFFGISCAFEAFFIFQYGILMSYNFFNLYKKKKVEYKELVNKEINQPIMTENSVLSICTDTSDPIHDPIELDSLGLFDIDPEEKHPKCVHIYQIATSIVIIIFQIYNTIYLPAKNSVKAGYIIAFIVVKIIYLPIILQYSFVDCIIYCKRRFNAIVDKKEKIIFVVLIILHIFLLIFFIVVYSLSKKTVFPTAKSARYIENNESWYKINGTQMVSPQSFCKIYSQTDGTLTTEDFAMLATLPRLYGVTKNGKCYIKPSMRGLFNTTMKYIFGKDYEKDGIEILCKKMSHYPVLVITSDKILNQTLSYFSKNDHINVLPKQFNIKNKNFFEIHNVEPLPSGLSSLDLAYKSCLKEKGAGNCDNKWDEFEEKFWPYLYTDEYVNISGFERYQINIEPGMIIEPSFIVNKKEKWAGTHYIVGSSYEDYWGVGYFIETSGRQYVPEIFKNFLIGYSYVKNAARNILLRMLWFNTKLFYFDIFSSKETNSILELYSQFDFNHQSLFTIGHSISGTSFKIASFYSDVQGIAFEASDGENNIVFLTNSKLKNKTNPAGQIVNIFSKTGFFTKYDQNCDVNGILPEKYKFPKVYDTACLTAISCSQTEKFIPFCKQVLQSKGKDPVKEFNESFNAYLRYYGYA